MIVTLSDKIYVDIDSVVLFLPHIIRGYTYTNPEYHAKQSMGFSVKNEKPIIQHFAIMLQDGKKTLVLPRGSLKKFIKIVHQVNPNVSIRINDKRDMGYDVDVHLSPTTILESQQLKIITLLDENNGGLMEMVPGGGKTISAIGFIAEKKKSTLILVHEHRLRTQWEKELKDRLIGNFTFGRFDGDKKIDGDICIGLIQTVSNLMKVDPNFLKKFGILIIDEAHHQPAEMYTKVVNNSTSFHRIGLTGTVKRKDGKHFLLFDSIGEVIDSIQAEDVKHRVTGFEYEMVPTEIRFEAPSVKRYTNMGPKIAVDHTKLLSLLVQNKERNELILNKIEVSLKEQRTTLVISTRVDHCKLLADALTERGYKVVLLIGDTRKATDWNTIRTDQSINCIVAQDSIASEGLDFPILSALHLTCPSSNNPKIKQKIGRIRRVCDNKPFPRVYDYVDNNVYFNDIKNNPLARSGQARQTFYRQLVAEYNVK